MTVELLCAGTRAVVEKIGGTKERVVHDWTGCRQGLISASTPA